MQRLKHFRLKAVWQTGKSYELAQERTGRHDHGCVVAKTVRFDIGIFGIHPRVRLQFNHYSHACGMVKTILPYHAEW